MKGVYKCLSIIQLFWFTLWSIIKFYNCEKIKLSLKYDFVALFMCLGYSDVRKNTIWNSLYPLEKRVMGFHGFIKIGIFFCLRWENRNLLLLTIFYNLLCFSVWFLTKTFPFLSLIIILFLIKKKKKKTVYKFPVPSLGTPPSTPHPGSRTTAFCGFACSSCISRISWSVDACTWLSTLNHWLWGGESNSQGVASLRVQYNDTFLHILWEHDISSEQFSFNMSTPHR